MTECQKETAFLRRVFLYNDTAERHNLEEELRQIERADRCMQRAVWLMIVVALLAIVGMGYSALLSGDPVQTPLPLVSRIFLRRGFGVSDLSRCVYALWLMTRREFNKCRERCRRLVSNFLESRLGEPMLIPSLPGGEVGLVKEGRP